MSDLGPLQNKDLPCWGNWAKATDPQSSLAVDHPAPPALSRRHPWELRCFDLTAIPDESFRTRGPNGCFQSRVSVLIKWILASKGDLL